MAEIDWRKVHKIRQTARDLMSSIADPELDRLMRDFDDWKKIKASIGYFARPDRGRKMIGLADVLDNTGVPVAALPGKIARGEFPAPLFDEPEMLWLHGDILAWIGDQ
jgi:hypothetical protein